MKKVTIQKLQTAQEQWLMGSTPEIVPKEDRGGDWYISQGVLKKEITVQEAIEERKKLGHFESGLLSAILGIKDGSISVGFSEIDKKTGRTIEDPKILGLWDANKQEIIRIEGRDLTQEVYAKFREFKSDLHLRESKPAREREIVSSERKA